MTETVVDPRPAAPRGRRGRVVVAVTTVLVVVGLGAWWVLRDDESPTLLGDRTGIGFHHDPRPVGDAGGFAALALPQPGDGEVLTFHDAPSVHFRRNTADATARVAVCVRAPGQAVFGVGDLRSLGTACEAVHDVAEGSRLAWGDPADGAAPEYPILVMVPAEPGLAAVDRVSYDYELESGESGIDVGTVDYRIRATRDGAGLGTHSGT